MFELQPAPADIRDGISDNPDLRVFRDFLSCFGQNLAVYEDFCGKNERLSAFTSRCKTLIDEQFVQSRGGLCHGWNLTIYGRRSQSRRRRYHRDFSIWPGLHVERRNHRLPDALM